MIWFFNSALAQPPSDAPVLFDVECDSSTIKQGKDGSYKLVMEGVEKVHWITDEHHRIAPSFPEVAADEVDMDASVQEEEGYYSAKKYAKKYDKYYGEDGEVSAYETFTLADGTKEKLRFTISDCKYNKKTNNLVYNIEPINAKQADKITGIESTMQTQSAVYSTQRTLWLPGWMPNGQGRNLDGANLESANLNFAKLQGANLTLARMNGASLLNANLDNADLNRANLTNANLGMARNLNQALNLDTAIWKNTTCPDGSINIGSEPCFAS